VFPQDLLRVCRVDQKEIVLKFLRDMLGIKDPMSVEGGKAVCKRVT
jgi:hypothetical protein